MEILHGCTLDVHIVDLLEKVFPQPGVETVGVCVECVSRTRQTLGGAEKEVTPEFSVEDGQTLAALSRHNWK